MCIFSAPVKDVSQTRIFARLTGAGEQCIAYDMRVRSDHEVAMVLPVPVVLPAQEDAVSFVDLSRHTKFFDEIEELFVPRFRAQNLGFGAPRSAPLKVHDVGDFIATFVPSPADWHRVDPRFRLPNVVDDHYPDYGFVVFQLKSQQRKSQQIHPMAFRFATRWPQAIFLPTLHVHGRKLKAKERFDHALYVQLQDGVPTLQPNHWREGDGYPNAYVTGAPGELVDRMAPVYKARLKGSLENRDIFLGAV